MDEIQIPKLPSEVDQRFNCVKVLPGEVVWRGKTYDLTRIDLATANKLADEKFPYLERKSTLATEKITPPTKNVVDDKDKK